MATGFKGFEAIIKGEWARCLSEIERNPATRARGRARLFCIEEYARTKLGRRGAPTRFIEPDDIGPEQWRQLITEEAASALFRLFGEISKARSAFDQYPWLNHSRGRFSPIFFIVGDLAKDSLSGVSQEQWYWIDGRHIVFPYRPWRC